LSDGGCNMKALSLGFLLAIRAKADMDLSAGSPSGLALPRPAVPPVLL
jgi:hypothetical protein